MTDSRQAVLQRPALAGQYGDHPTLPAFHDTVQRYRIPHQYFHEMIDGVSSDLQPSIWRCTSTTSPSATATPFATRAPS